MLLPSLLDGSTVLKLLQILLNMSPLHPKAAT
jgi:hypothetical protein